MKYLYRIIVTLILFPIGFTLDIFAYTLLGTITVAGIISILLGIVTLQKEMIHEVLDLICMPFHEAFMYWVNYIKTGEFNRW